MDLGTLTLATHGKPAGSVRDDNWPSIAYDVAIMDGEREIWRGPFYLGVGHVKPQALRFGLRTDNMAAAYLAEDWARKPGAQFTDKKLWADVAAKLAQQQKIAPKLEDVLHSLLSDGAAFFDAQSFEDWASDLGYDSDSRKAYATFEACREIGRKLTAELGAERIAELREAFQDY